MQILITGGTGLIGQALIPVLLKRGHQLVLLTRDKEAALHKLAKPAPHFEAIIESLEQVNFNHLDAVINLAGEPMAEKRWSTARKALLCESRWQLTRQLVEKIKSAKSPPSVLISGSAIGIYGRQDKTSIDEQFTAFYPEFSHSLCDQWEQIANAAQSDKTRVCLLRTGIVLAATGGALAKMLPAFRLGLGGPIATGEQMMSWIHLADMVSLIIFLLDQQTLNGPFNATAPHPVSNAVFSKTLAATLHRPCFFRVPETLLKLGMGELSDLLIYGQAVVPAKLQKAGFQFRYPELDAALRSLL
jgi:uncharacterized protein (TIGR01777 family)